jgi:hypothetical protein
VLSHTFKSNFALALPFEKFCLEFLEQFFFLFNRQLLQTINDRDCSARCRVK